MNAATARSAWSHRSNEVAGGGDVLVVEGESGVDEVRQGAVLAAAWEARTEKAAGRGEGKGVTTWDEECWNRGMLAKGDASFSLD